MARGRSNNRRRRRGRFSFLLRAACAVLVIGAIVAALTLFFKVEDFVVEGSARYTKEEIVEASGIEIEDNLFLLNKYRAAQSVFEQLPYVESAVIKRALPSTIRITVQECSAAAGIVQQDGTWLVSAQGKILEQSFDIPRGCPVVTGGVAVEPALSMPLVLDTDFKTDALLALLDAARTRGVLTNINSVDLSDDSALQLTYLDRFAVKMPWTADMDYKLQSIAAVVERLEENETGTINLMTDGKASFVPGKV